MADFKQQALRYHAEPTPGKISIEISKPAETVTDLALAYSPGVAEPVLPMSTMSTNTQLRATWWR